MTIIIEEGKVEEREHAFEAVNEGKVKKARKRVKKSDQNLSQASASTPATPTAASVVDVQESDRKEKKARKPRLKKKVQLSEVEVATAVFPTKLANTSELAVLSVTGGCNGNEHHASDKKEVDSMSAKAEDAMIISSPGRLNSTVASTKGAESEEKDKEDEKIAKARKKASKREAQKAELAMKQTEGSGKTSKKDKEEKKRKRQDEVNPAMPAPSFASASTHTDTLENQTKTRKTKRSKVDSINSAVEPANSPPQDYEGTAIFADPTLSDQAKKNIFYVHLYALSRQPLSSSKGPVWKFNKAKQNWLMRNIFSLVEIPEAYFDLVLEYLKTIQGHSRTALIEIARKTIQPSSAESVSEKMETTDSATELPIGQNELEKRGNDIEMANVSSANSAEGDKEQDEKAEAVKARARKLLEAIEV
ncbi:uncharacterized protein L203_105828 [Cryptococcus depauperatus CBS 7841]|uniref:Uncharacterized protein n=1 Tax=Cryptococcus depauperatus CBS 7841 TaxID=1295531 RepID=A0A1E3I9V4_9TREE|nr:hypothetical protein L203_04977 [Cryptococcus depauperatus CBS 7841]